MPAKKPTKSRVSNSKVNKKSKIPKWVIGVVVLLVAAVGIALVYQSFASNYPTQRSGFMIIRPEDNAKYANPIRSITGWVCVRANFNSPYTNFRDRYHWYIQEKRGAQWVQVRQSGEYRANGNTDQACYDRQIDSNKVYRVKFDPADSIYMSGDYDVYGFQVYLESGGNMSNTEASAGTGAVEGSIPETASPEGN